MIEQTSESYVVHLMESNYWTQGAAHFRVRDGEITLAEHSLLVEDRLNQLGPQAGLTIESQNRLKVVAYYHDIGKPHLKRASNKVIIPPYHHELSHQIAVNLGITDERILALIMNHEQPWALYRGRRHNQNWPHSVKRIVAKLSPIEEQPIACLEIITFAYADRLGDRISNKIREFESSCWFETVAYQAGLVEEPETVFNIARDLAYKEGLYN